MLEEIIFLLEFAAFFFGFSAVALSIMPFDIPDELVPGIRIKLLCVGVFLIGVLMVILTYQTVRLA